MPALTLAPNGECLPTDRRVEKLALCHDRSSSLQKKFGRHRPCAKEWYFPLCKGGFVRSYQEFLVKIYSAFWGHGVNTWMRSQG